MKVFIEHRPDRNFEVWMRATEMIDGKQYDVEAVMPENIGILGNAVMIGYADEWAKEAIRVGREKLGLPAQ